MEVEVPIAGHMIVLGTVSPRRNVTSADAAPLPDTKCIDSSEATTHSSKARETCNHSGISLNRRLAVAIAVPLCLLFLLAVLGIVLYCTRRRRPLRLGTGGRRRSSPQSHRNNFDEPINTSPAEPSPEEEIEWQRPPTTVKRSDDGLSRITEMPSVSDATLDRGIPGVGHEASPSPSVLPQELPSSISSHSETINAADSGSDDFEGHFSGFDEDPFSDSAAVSIPKEVSQNISPCSQPVQSRPQIDTTSSISSKSSEHPVTAMNTGGPNSVSDEGLDNQTNRAMSRTLSRESQDEQMPSELESITSGDQELPEPASKPPEAEQHMPEPGGTSPLQDTRLDRPESRTIPVHYGRSSSVGAKELGQHALATEQQDGSEDPKTSRSADDVLPEDHFLDAFVSPSSNEYPAPPLSDRHSWLEEAEQVHERPASPSTDTRQCPQPEHAEM